MKVASENRDLNIQKSNGFTLLELIVTIVIAVSITAISAAAYSRLSSSAALKATTQDMLVTLRHARNTAIKNNKEVIFLIDLDKKIYEIVGSNRQRLLDKSLTLKLFSAKFYGTSKTISQIRFAPDGSSSGGEIKISNGKKINRIKVEWLTGKVDLSHG